jgi:hypothetical protein
MLTVRQCAGMVGELRWSQYAVVLKLVVMSCLSSLLSRLQLSELSKTVENSVYWTGWCSTAQVCSSGCKRTHKSRCGARLHDGQRRQTLWYREGRGRVEAAMQLASTRLAASRWRRCWRRRRGPWSSSPERRRRSERGYVSAEEAVEAVAVKAAAEAVESCEAEAAGGQTSGAGVGGAAGAGGARERERHTHMRTAPWPCRKHSLRLEQLHQQPARSPSAPETRTVIPPGRVRWMWAMYIIGTRGRCSHQRFERCGW